MTRAVRTARAVSIDHDRQVVIKRYPGRDQAQREWRALGLLAQHAPRLAPEPVRADLDGGEPSVVMSLLPGAPLGTAPLTPAQERAVGHALGQLWQAVPAGQIRPLPGEQPPPARFEQLVRARLAQAGGADDPAARQALARAADWLDRQAGLAARPAGRAARPAGPVVTSVLGQGDGHLASFLWDGERVRLVGFEDSGRSDRTFELAMLTEHVSAWRDGGMDAARFAADFGLCPAEQARLTDWRRLAALYWLLRLRERGDQRAVRHQAARLASLL